MNFGLDPSGLWRVIPSGNLIKRGGGFSLLKQTTNHKFWRILAVHHEGFFYFKL